MSNSVVVVAEEIIANWRTSGTARFVWKVDLAKAYDSFDWHFLWNVLKRLGFAGGLDQLNEAMCMYHNVRGTGQRQAPRGVDSPARAPLIHLWRPIRWPFARNSYVFVAILQDFRPWADRGASRCYRTQTTPRSSCLDRQLQRTSCPPCWTYSRTSQACN